jgi:uncharacterized protein
MCLPSNMINSAVISFIFLIAGLLVAWILLTNYPVYAQTPAEFRLIQNNSANDSNISVTGIASVKVKPDEAVVSLGVETIGKTANSALSANSDAMNKVINALKRLGVKENETSTSAFSISPNHNDSQTSSARDRVTGFTVSNSIQIDSANINNISKWIDTSIETGANTLNNIAITLSDKKLEDTKINLIKKALDDARTKADIAATAVGLKVVGIKSINLGEIGVQLPPIPLGKEMSTTTGTVNNASTPLIPGQEQVTETVNVVFLLANVNK